MNGSMYKPYIKTLRPEQWYKNLVVFVAIIFAAGLFNPQAWLYSILTFIAFCLLSSAGYIVNDLHDIEADKLHPTRKNRPIASNLIGKKTAITLAVILTLISLPILSFVGLNTLLVGLTYLTLTLFYTRYLKPQYYIGLTAISLGFVLRALAGCTAIIVTPSGWLLSCVFILALVLTTAKRRHEGTKELAIALLFIYTAYTFYQTPLMVPSVIPAAYIIFRFLHTLQLHPTKVKFNPESLLKDWRLLGATLLWLIMVSLVLHLSP